MRHGAESTAPPATRRSPPPSTAFWERLAAAPARLLLLDYDGTLAPLRIDRARARPAPGIVPALRRILARGAAEVAVMSGRPAGEVLPFLGGLDVEVVGEHGWERRPRGGGVERLPLEPAQARALAGAVRLCREARLGPRLEPKYASLAVHTRGLDPAAVRRTETQARALLGPLTRRARVDLRGFDGGIELRAIGADKGTAVASAVERLGLAGFAVYLGDDWTDEDAFRVIALRGGAGILVRALDRPTNATFRLGGPRDVVELLERVAALGKPGERAEPRAPRHGRCAAARLVVVSNRLPELAAPRTLEERRSAAVGGLVSALRPALERTARSLWFGWSGRGVAAAEAGRVHRGQAGPVETLGIDLAEADVDGHYYGFCNRALWPIMHCFSGRAAPDAREYASYERVNALFARALRPRLGPSDRVWVHDYHLLLLARELRRRGFAGRIGFFLHVPFPPGEIFEILPSARELLEGMLAHDVVGFHTEGYLTNYVRAVRDELGVDRPDEGGLLTFAGRTQRAGVYPIGIDPAPYRAWASEDASRRRGRKLRGVVHDRKIVLGVDRLDYTKGIAERLRAFARLLETAPRFRRHVCFIQISAPSRTRIPEYVRQRREVEELVGHINGKFGEEDWVPVRYLFRSYSQRALAALYREADVCLVSPLRDGMNLVAKEYVAAQTGNPGVLVLSRFAGAAEELKEALIVNPFDIDGTARTLGRALDMPLEERARRQAALLARVTARTADRWAESFERDLAGDPRQPPG